AQASSLCGACKEACPVDIDLPKLLVRVRSGLAPKRPDLEFPQTSDGGLSTLSKIFMRIYSQVARSPRLFALSLKLASLGTHLVSPFSNMFRIPAFTGWGYSKDFPRFASKNFRARFQESKNLLSETVKAQPVIHNHSPAKEETFRLSSHDPDVLRESDMDKVERFAKEFTAVSGKMNRANANDLTNKIVELLQARGITQIHVEPNLLDQAILQKAGITVSHTPDPAIRVGVTKAICGLADTGSILEADGEGRSLHASLLPEIHIALLRESEILPSLDQGVHLMRGSKSAVFITGPSRTGDIEMSQTIGVHGPGEVHVFLVDD
ncbi:MAG TPA: LUD domain-containing protein, partial [Anaerolineales bacterium]|nr:LUD domain-containing protein [Anaerolineales bacterium]